MTRLFFWLVAIGMFAPAEAAEQKVRAQLKITAEAHNSCAPYDGAAIEIVMLWPEAPEASLRIALWGAGLQALESGAKEIMLDGSSSSTGAGTVVSCEKDKLCETVLPARLKVQQYEKGKFISGEIFWKEKGMVQELVVPFSAPYVHKQVYCG